MKVLLISSNIATTPCAVYPLGVSMVAAALQNANHEIAQFDYLQSAKSIPTLLAKVNTFAPDIIGISIRNIDNVNSLNTIGYIDTVKNIICELRKQFSGKIVLGGSAFSIIPTEIMNYCQADYGVVGEGEISFVKFVNDAKRGIYPKQRILHSDIRLTGNEIISPNYDHKLLQFYLQYGKIAPVQTKRGCPHHCTYCSYPYLEGKQFRCRDPKQVVDDMLLLSEKHGAKLIFFTDSVFNDKAGHYLQIMQEIQKRKITIPWTAFFKPKGLTEKIVTLMKECGLVAAEVGADASTDQTLSALAKNFTFADIQTTNRLFVKHNIATANYFMFAAPGETKETVQQGIANIIALEGAASFIFMGIRILPHTPLYDLAIKEKIIQKNQSLLDTIYYYSPNIPLPWLENTLKTGFSKIRHCVFPPDDLETSLHFLHKMGFTGLQYDKLVNRKR